MREMTRMSVASLKMLYRDQQAVVFAAVSPLIFIGMLALFGDLRLGVGSASVDFLDFVVPGMAAFWIMYFAIYAMSAAAAGYRSAGILKRIAASPASPARFVVAQVAARVLVGVAQGAVIVAVGAALGADVKIGATLAWLVPVAVAGTLIALNIGFILAGVTGTPEGAASLASLVVMPLFFLAGAMFPIEAFPTVVERVVEFLPMTPLVESMRAIASGQAVAEIGGELLILGAWLVASFLMASVTFRFAEKS